jgi:hypothetical protein
LRDPPNRVLQTALDVDAGPLRHRTGVSQLASKAERARELRSE